MEDKKDNGAFLVKKVSRLCVGLYKLTDFFNPEEPLTNEIREKSLNLLNTILSYTKPSGVSPESLIKDITDTINVIHIYSDILVLSNMISEINSRIIKDELLSVMTLTESYFRDHFGYLISINDFLGSTELTLPISTLPKFEAKPNALATSTIGEVITNKNSSNTVNYDRRAKIIDFLRKNGQVTIKDLVGVIRGCSEKTIQRELTSLIETGFVRREGERRWSKYLLSS